MGEIECNKLLFVGGSSDSGFVKTESDEYCGDTSSVSVSSREALDAIAELAGVGHKGMGLVCGLNLQTRY